VEKYGMIDFLTNELNKLHKLKHVDKTIIEKFYRRIKRDERLIQEENSSNHFCCFFLPFHKQTGLIYLVDHIKGRDWMPPGGHIEENEFPLETIRREFLEELSHHLEREKIELFDLSVKKINKPEQLCKIHYDLWYLVYTDKINFIYDKKEFYQAGWFSIEKGLQLIKTADYNVIVKRLLSL
jgi:8-oxo-dGTP pyrophosphatase MutT (NUDIX family)